MSAGARNTNNDSCRDLNGRRLGVVKEAKKLTEYLEGESERKRQMDEAQKKKYAKLERMLGRAPRNEKDLAEAAERMADAGEDFDEGSASPEAGPSRGIGSLAQADTATQRRSANGNGASAAAGTKRKERIEDSQYIEQSREIVENVRSAVASAMMKKKKKLNKDKGKTNASSSASGSSVAAST
uniref:SDE2-like domain-containing protein n=2 Tax=Kalmanozyma brasiliensis (strain GHG001) TaxID=1365824 RepID=V5GKS5_KALBG